jgi:hypothetical protein
MAKLNFRAIPFASSLWITAPIRRIGEAHPTAFLEYNSSATVRSSFAQKPQSPRTLNRSLFFSKIADKSQILSKVVKTVSGSMVWCACKRGCKFEEREIRGFIALECQIQQTHSQLNPKCGSQSLNKAIQYWTFIISSINFLRYVMIVSPSIYSLGREKTIGRRKQSSRHSIQMK